MDGAAGPETKGSGRVTEQGTAAECGSGGAAGTVEVKGSGAVKSADRTIELLELLAGYSEPLTLSEIHRRLAYPKSSLFVLLRTLVARGWVETDRRGTGYSIGVRAPLVRPSYLAPAPGIRPATRVLA